MVKLAYEIIKRHFEADYSYIFNLNPSPSKDGVEQLLDYLKKKDYSYWLVKCASDKDYIHYHGMLRLYPKDDDDIEKIKKAIYKQINTYVGRRVPLVRPDSLKAWYDYIHGSTNRYVEEAFSIKTCERKGASAPASDKGPTLVVGMSAPGRLSDTECYD